MSDIQPGMWAVVNDWGFRIAQVVKVSAQCAWIKGRENSRDRRIYRDKVLCVLPVKATAEKLAERLTSALAERHRREAAARAWFAKEQSRLLAKASSDDSRLTLNGRDVT